MATALPFYVLLFEDLNAHVIREMSIERNMQRGLLNCVHDNGVLSLVLKNPRVSPGWGI
jgi:hypothetical protein